MDELIEDLKSLCSIDEMLAYCQTHGVNLVDLYQLHSRVEMLLLIATRPEMWGDEVIDYRWRMTDHYLEQHNMKGDKQ